MSEITLFLDTNIFIQCRVLKELDWSLACAADNIRLIVATPVVDEIDHFKRDPNPRRSKRARLATDLLRQAVTFFPSALVIRDSAPRVTLAFTTPLPAGTSPPPQLDRARPDDRLIEEILNYRVDDPSTTIVTDDTALLLRAKQLHVPVLTVPDGWFLPPEPDESSKRIAVLEATVASLRAAEANLSVEITDAQDAPVRQISTTLPLYSEMTVGEIEGLTESVLARHPKVTEFTREPDPPPYAGNSDLIGDLYKLARPAMLWQPPAQHLIERYNDDYKKWSAAVKGRFTSLSTELNASSRIIPLHIILTNTGSKPADGVLIELSCRGPVRIYASANDDLPRLINQVYEFPPAGTLPRPPAPPKGRRGIEGLMGIANMFETSIGDQLRSIVPRIDRDRFSRDPHAIYMRDEEDSDDQSLSFVCGELRHQRDPQVIRLWLVAMFTSEPIEAVVHCQVSARNMANALEMRMPVEIASQTRSTIDVGSDWSFGAEPSKDA